MLLEVDGIDVYYGKSYILRGVSLHLDRGEAVALVGRNGAGKTTTLRTIMGLVHPRKGHIKFDGGAMNSVPPFRRARMGIGYVPQEKDLFTKMTVHENLKTGGRADYPKTGWSMAFELFPILKERLDQKAGSLSGGEQQMLTVARALLTNPKLLLLDEPSAGLMPVMILRLTEVIRKLHAGGISILMVEERISMALELSSRLYVLDVGQIVYEDATADLNEAELVEHYMGAR
jgi:branched-chain amino acid transport system ATP-binding protein